MGIIPLRVCRDFKMRRVTHFSPTDRLSLTLFYCCSSRTTRGGSVTMEKQGLVTYRCCKEDVTFCNILRDAWLISTKTQPCWQIAYSFSHHYADNSTVTTGLRKDFFMQKTYFFAALSANAQSLSKNIGQIRYQGTGPLCRHPAKTTETHAKAITNVKIHFLVWLRHRYCKQLICNSIFSY